MINIFTDGASRGNPGKASIAFCVKDENDKIIFSYGEQIGLATNNVAEYKAVILALFWVLKNKDKIDQKVAFFLDSNLVCSQLNGLFKIKNANLRNLYFEIKQKEAEINKQITYAYIPREKNREADKIANQVLDNMPITSLK